MANQRRKPADQLQGWGSRYRGTAPVALKAVAECRSALSMPANLQPEARRAWEALMQSGMMGAIDPAADGPALHRLFHCLSERERLQPIAEKTPLVKGSMGQYTANPLYAVIAGLSAEIAKLWTDFGLTPLARMRLGLVLTKTELGLAELEERLERGRRAYDPDEVIDLGALDPGA